MSISVTVEPWAWHLLAGLAYLAIGTVFTLWLRRTARVERIGAKKPVWEWTLMALVWPSLVIMGVIVGLYWVMKAEV